MDTSFAKTSRNKKKRFILDEFRINIILGVYGKVDIVPIYSSVPQHIVVRLPWATTQCSNTLGDIFV
jgi:hypothetical protein